VLGLGFYVRVSDSCQSAVLASRPIAQIAQSCLTIIVEAHVFQSVFHIQSS